MSTEDTSVFDRYREAEIDIGLLEAKAPIAVTNAIRFVVNELHQTNLMMKMIVDAQHYQGMQLDKLRETVAGENETATDITPTCESIESVNVTVEELARASAQAFCSDPEANYQTETDISAAQDIIDYLNRNRWERRERLERHETDEIRPDVERHGQEFAKDG